MRGFGRLFAGILLAGAVVGAAAFAHLLGSVPAPSPFAAGQLPLAPRTPLPVEAAPWSPDPPVARHVAALRPVGSPILAPVARLAARPTVHTPAHAAALHVTPVSVPSAPLTAQAQVAPDPPAAARPAPPAPVTPAPAASTPVAAPAAAPTLASRALTRTAPTVTTAAVAPASATTSNDSRRQSGFDHRRGYRSNDDGNDDWNNGSKSNSSDKDTKSLTPLGNVPVTVTSPVPAPTPAPAPVAAIRPPSVDPPSGGSPWSGDHGSGSHAGWHGDAGSDHSH
jgi:hypothetical protein